MGFLKITPINYPWGILIIPLRGHLEVHEKFHPTTSFIGMRFSIISYFLSCLHKQSSSCYRMGLNLMTYVFEDIHFDHFSKMSVNRNRDPALVNISKTVQILLIVILQTNFILLIQDFTQYQVFQRDISLAA